MTAMRDAAAGMPGQTWDLDPWDLDHDHPQGRSMSRYRTTTIACLSPVNAAVLVVTAGPFTIVGPGETCLMCDEPLEIGTTCVFATCSGRSGVAHEDCAEPAD